MIEPWLEQFHNAWKAHDIDTVMNLFADDVEYWETPHTPLSGKEVVRQEWQAILEQENIGADWTIFSSSNDNRYTVLWSLKYQRSGATKQSAGVYLIQLNTSGLCNYFYYVGEDKK